MASHRIRGWAATSVLLLLGWGGGPGRTAPAGGVPAPAVQVETLARGSRSWDGSSLPAYPIGRPEVTVLRITIPAGLRLPAHSHPLVNAGVLLQGRLRVTTAQGAVKELRAGDGLIEVVNQAHSGESLGPGPAVIVVVYAGSPGVPLSVPAAMPARP